MGAGQVTAVHRVQLLLPEPLPQIGQLTVALGGNHAVILSMGYPEEVALRLGVADEKNFRCHSGARSLM